VLVLLFAAYTFFSVAGLLLLKNWMPLARAEIVDGRWLTVEALGAVAGASSYIASFLIWLVILYRVPVSRAYPVAIGLTLTFTALGSRFILGETLALTHVVGIVTVFAGVVLLSLPGGAT
jgi:multidrug transporter EmrE-like cation transporter